MGTAEAVSFWRFVIGGSGTIDKAEQRVPFDVTNELTKLMLSASSGAEKAQEYSDTGIQLIPFGTVIDNIESIPLPDIWSRAKAPLHQLAVDMINLHQSQTKSNTAFFTNGFSQYEIGWEVDAVVQQHPFGVRGAGNDRRIRLTSTMIGRISRAELGMYEGIGKVQAEINDRYHALSTLDRHGLTWLFLTAFR